MKRFFRAFTLAEVLVTLGIIGVVAALTLPSLSTATQRQRIGASVAKAFNTLENSNKMMLANTGARNLREACGVNYPACLASITTGSYREEGGMWIFTSKDGIAFMQPAVAGNPPEPGTIEADAFARTGGLTDYVGNSNMPVGAFGNGDTLNPMYSEIAYPITIDINGVDREPNIVSEDRFGVFVDILGPVIALGSDEYRTVSASDTDSLWEQGVTSAVYSWRNGNCDENGVQDPALCTGSIVDNNFRVIY